MSKRLSQLTLVPRRNPQLHCVNEKIAGLAAVKPWCDLYAAFSLAAHLATEAIEATEELRQMPGVEVRAFCISASPGCPVSNEQVDVCDTSGTLARFVYAQTIRGSDSRTVR